MLLGATFLCSLTAHGAVWPFPPPLDKIVELSDIIFKATVVTTIPSLTKGPDDYYAGDCGEHTTLFKVISVLKGTVRGSTLTFTYNNGFPEINYIPPQYRFLPGQTYLICAERTANPEVFQPISMGPTQGPRHTVTLCRDANPVGAKSYKETLCAELIAQLQGHDSVAVLAVMSELDRLSGGPEYRATTDFDRVEVLAAMQGLTKSPNPTIAHAALRMIGNGNETTERHR